MDTLTERILVVRIKGSIYVIHPDSDDAPDIAVLGFPIYASDVILDEKYHDQFMLIKHLPQKEVHRYFREVING